MVLSVGAGCGADPPPSVIDPGQIEQHGERDPSSGMSAEADIGGMDDMKVQKVFRQASDKLTACYKKGTEHLAYLAGDVRFALRITKAGTARWVYVKETTLGDHETEACMMAALKALTWPKPLGGEGLVENNFTFDLEGDDRHAVSWTARQLGSAQKTAKSALTKCQETAGTKGLKATMYVEPDGKASSIGVSSADEHGASASECVIEALREIKFPSPGSFAAKVSVSTE